MRVAEAIEKCCLAGFLRSLVSFAQESSPFFQTKLDY
jgi:hypothetical protein